VSDRWRPVSPVTGRLDAFQWQVPVAALPSNKAVVLETDAFDDPLIAPPQAEALPSAEPVVETVITPVEATAEPVVAAATAEPVTATVVLEPEAAAESREPAPAAVTETAVPLPPPPMFHRRTTPAAAPVIPIVRAPDDPGIDEEAPPENEFAERAPPANQSGNWRGYTRRDN
jgi:HemY protein